MSRFYNAQRTRNLYRPGADGHFNLSRSKIDLFLQCPRCFYVDRRLGTGQPPGYPFAINSAVDNLLKKEFDRHRAEGTRHPYQVEAEIDAVPAPHPQLDEWRENFKGVRALHVDTGLVISGAIDDLWVSPDGRYLVVDYKATAKSAPVVSLEKDWMAGYKRQVEVYQWLLRQNGLDVDDTAWFVYCTGRADADAFNACVEFDVNLIPYRGNDGWVDAAIYGMYDCLNGPDVPQAGPDCDYCAYVDSVRGHLDPKQQSLL